MKEYLYSVDEAYNLFCYEPSEPKSPAPLPIDLRPRIQYKESHMRHAMNIPIDELKVFIFGIYGLRMNQYLWMKS